MAAKPIDVVDEKGQAFLVFDGDPGWTSARALYNHGVREIILPRHTLLTGEILDIALPNMVKWNVEIPAVARLLRRYVRLQDCIKYLKEHRS